MSGAACPWAGFQGQQPLDGDQKGGTPLDGTMQLTFGERDRTGTVALAGVSPASFMPASQSPLGGFSPGADVFGETPKTAVETTALPKSTA